MYPILLHLGPVQVHSYGVMLMLAFIAGILLSRRQARRLGLDPDLPVDLGVWILIGGVVFARLIFVMLDWRDYIVHPLTILMIWREGGLSFYGGLLGGVIAVAVFAWRAKLSYWTFADMLAPGLALGYAIARVGCFLNGCCYGVPTKLPWAVRFRLSPDSTVTTPPCHPTQIYSSLGSLVVLALLLRLQPRLKVRGQLFLSYLMFYTVLRSFVEIFRRGATAQALFGPVTQAQFASFLIFLAAGGVFLWMGRRARATRSPQTQARGADVSPATSSRGNRSTRSDIR